MTIDLNSAPAFGFEFKTIHFKNNENRYIANNIGKLLGYIPLVGTVIGAARIYNAVNNETKFDSLTQARHITRGAIELTSCGFLLIIPDLLVSLGRLAKAELSACFSIYNPADFS